MRNIKIVIIFGLILLGLTSQAQARVNDGYNYSKKIESRYFTIYLENGTNPDVLARKLQVPASIKTIIRKPIDFSDSHNLKDQLDLLFLSVSEIMEIRLSEFNCKIKVCKNNESLANVSRNLFGRQIKTAGFYVLAIDTLYINAEDVSIHVLGHELSHAIQCHYFVVPPPEKLQEVLAGYVEYQLRKYHNALPTQ